MKIARCLSFPALVYLGIALFLSVVPARSETPPEIQMLTDGEQLDPASTLEFRFSVPMVSRDDLGIATAESPIVFSPAMPGKFTWLSTKSGVFVPDDAPPLGASVTISARPDLKSAEAKPVGKGFQAHLKTPPFAIYPPQRIPGDDATVEARPEVRFAFNLAVDLASTGKIFQFVAENGEKISAQVRFATGADFFTLPPTQGDWMERWKLARSGSAKPDSTDDEAAEERKKPLPNRLIVQPTTPLSTGTKWSIRMGSGIASADGKYRLTAAMNLPLGQVEPFVISSLEASSQINSGRTLVLSFSKDLAPDITKENGAGFFQITPEVKNLRVDPSYSSLTLSGDFQRDQDYQITFNSRLISESGAPLDGAATRSFRFGAVKPRIYLPEITGTQIRQGLRKFLVRSVNLQKLQVTARLVSSPEIAKAIGAFAAYNKEYDENNPDEIYQPLVADAVAGKVIKQTTFDLTDPIDAAQTTELDWDKIVGAKAAGAIYLTVEGEPRADVGGKRPGAQSLVQVTNIGVLWKKTGDDLQLNIFSLETGKAISDASLVLLDKDLKPQTRAASDAQGEATMAVPADVKWLIVDLADDALALRMGEESEDLPTAGFNLPIYYSSWESRVETDATRGLVFTDRPLYLPGEKVKIKAYFRTTTTAAISPAANRKVTIRVFDAKGETIRTIQTTTDAHGDLDDEFSLSSSGVGRHTLRLESPDGGNAYTSFEVAEFQPDAFALKAVLPDRLAASEKFSADISAEYFFGAALSQAQVRWTLRQAVSSVRPEGFEKFELPISEDGPAKNLSLHGETTLDKDGNGRIVPQLPEPKGAPMKNILTVEATDLNQQTVSSSRTVYQDSSDYYLGIERPESAVFRANEAFPIRVIALAPDGQPLPKSVKVTSEIVFKRHDTVRVQGAGKSISFRTEETEEIVSSSDGKSLIPEKEADQWNVREGQTALLKTGKPGDYLLRVKSTDPNRREAVTEWSFFVYGKDRTVWDYKNPAQVDLVPDKASYQIGDVAKILVKAPISGEALISIQQRDRILRTERVQLEGNAPTIEVPVSALDAPNIFVEIILIRGTNDSTRKFKMPEYRHGICRLNVVDRAKALQVVLTPSASQIEPDLDLITEIQVRDGLGQPMPHANVTFFAVDDGILALTGYERPNPAETFGAPWPLNVRTGLSISDLMPENPEDLVFGNKGYLIGGGGLEGPGLKLRQDFPGTLAWLPNLQTDAAGKVSVKFKVPDALTRYRLVAVASALSDYFGSGESSFMIRKALSLMPGLGQFANVGDQIAARCVVRNDTGTDGSAEVTLGLDSTAESDKPLTISVPVKTGSSVAVAFPVRFRKMGTASWQWTTRLNVEGRVYQDGVVSTMKVGSPSILLRETYLTDLSGKANDLLKDINPQLLEGEGTATITVANTRLANLRESITQLLEYPYGCAEQTASALIPWLALKDLQPVLPEMTGSDSKKAIQTSVDKLFSMQTPSGGFAYWPGGKSPSLFASAYGVMALALLEKQGTPLPPGWEPLKKWLSSELRDASKMREEQLADCTLGLYALSLAGRAEPAYQENLYNRRAELSLETRALLALAMLQSKGSSDAIGQLLDSRQPAPESVSWFGGEARERAIQLLAWSRFKPKSGEVPKLVNELLAYRKNGEWGTTQQNAWALLALSEYFSRVEKGGKNVTGTLLTDTQKIPFSVTKEQPSETHVFDFSSVAPPKLLAVENPKKTALFGETRFVVRPPVANQPRQNRGYAVSRTYQKLDLEGKAVAAEDLQVGDRVLVTLRLETPRPGHFVAIDDPLPSVFEAVNPAFQSRVVAGGDARDEDWASDYREMRKDRVLIFCDHLPAGAFSFHYLARVRSAGTVTAPATKVEEMYRPERFGLGETLSIVSRATK